jgi:hypothetical protein
VAQQSCWSGCRVRAPVCIRRSLPRHHSARALAVTSVRAKTAILVLGILAVGLALCWAVGLVEFTYLNVVPNEPLQHPRKVQVIDGTNMVLESGEMISFWPSDSSDRSKEELYLEISNMVSHSDFQIDIETNKAGSLDILVRRYRKFRDTVPPFVIPIVRETVGRQRRGVVAFGAYTPMSSQPNGAANRSQPARSETNRASAAAGSGR